MTSQNPWDVLVDVEAQQQPYQEVEQKFPELKASQVDSSEAPWQSLRSAPETGGEQAVRVGAQLTTRALEQLYGFPGDVEKFGRNLLNLPPKKLPYMDKDFKNPEPIVSKETFLPTSHELREKGKKIHGEKFEPRNEIEKIAGNVVGKWIVSPGGPWMKAASALGSEASKEIAGALGASEDTKSLVDMGTSFAVSRFNAPTIRNYWNNEYALATGSIPRNAVIAANRVQPTLTAVRNRVLAGGHADWKPAVIQQIDALERNIQNGAIHVRDVDRAVHDINRQMYAANTPAIARRELHTLAAGGRRILRQYGQNNLRFLEHWRNANSAYAGWAANRAASNFMERHVNKLTAGGGTSALMSFMLKGAEATGKTVAAIASTYGITKAAEFTARVFANPVTRRYYMNTMLGALRENAPQMITNFNKLDNELKKEFKGQKGSKT